MTVKEEILNIFNIIAVPTEVFEDINETPRWRIPFIVLVISSVVIGWFMIPAKMEPMKKIFSSSFGETGAEAAVKGIMKTMFVAELIVEPVMKFIHWIVLACIIYLICMAFVKENLCSFRKLYAAIAYLETIFIFMSILTVMVIYANGIENIERSDDLTFFKGVDFFLRDRNSNPVLSFILSNINPFSIWYVVTLAIGIQIIAKLDRLKSLAVSSTAWLVAIALSLLQSKATKFLMDLIS